MAIVRSLQICCIYQIATVRVWPFSNSFFRWNKLFFLERDSTYVTSRILLVEGWRYRRKIITSKHRGRESCPTASPGKICAAIKKVLREGDYKNAQLAHSSCVSKFADKYGRTHGLPWQNIVNAHIHHINFLVKDILISLIFSKHGEYFLGLAWSSDVYQH
jgi:hypothetical protein